MFILGITGGIGSGKSTVSSILRERGLTVLDADEISRQVTSAGGRALPLISETFGPRAINTDGSMNRRYVSQLVFNDKADLDLLSTIVHRFVFDEIEERTVRERDKGTKCVVLDVPIPVNKFTDMCNQIWVVTCDEEVRLARLVARGLDREEARRRIEMQMSDDEYCSLGDFSIDNSWDRAALEEKVEKLIKEQLHERGIRI
ncbi:MAG: dephospho-CoA kinase [Saccharofermentans sp.]|jgi:dephospho-CoA kinase|nr:dephospho-CoA kinase [Mageeibacillus sp.]MCI1264908.1 dephospho-CoA kinase [Saccharofermentans sp.]MCI1275792.1 dephospho-CoA kinase [Saccharofermentans sp.]MCI1769827.1 dephospho-CoA kinase [Mageeibacillus sp.]MCI2043722.1 dephospho-CoA kinase [Mageeibacillus sp.]